MATIAFIKPREEALRCVRVDALGEEGIVEGIPSESSGDEVEGSGGLMEALLVAQIAIAKALLHGLKICVEGGELWITVASSPCHEEIDGSAALMGCCGKLAQRIEALLPIGVKLADAGDLALFLEKDGIPLVEGILAGEQKTADGAFLGGVFEIIAVLVPEVATVSDAFGVDGICGRFFEHGLELFIEGVGCIAVGVAIADEEDLVGLLLCVGCVKRHEEAPCKKAGEEEKEAEGGYVGEDGVWFHESIALRRKRARSWRR
jgi:hypothetical protein